MGQPDLKSIIREEYVKCAKDPIHFLRKYGYIQHPQRGRIIFNLYPFQSKVLNLFQSGEDEIILKSRQLGISTLVAGYILWLMNFHADKNVLCVATKQDTAKNLVTKVKFMWENLPSWLKVAHEEKNKLTLRLQNGSQVKAVAASSDAGRSEAVTLLIIDEAAFIDQIDSIWASAQQTLATGGQSIILSTPNGTGNFFHKTWVRAKEGKNGFLPIKLPWQVHPERNQAWRDEQDELLGDPRIASQECDCDFSTSGDIVFYSEWIKFIEETTIEEPIERRGVNNNLWIWERPDYSREYMVVADVARGDGKDFSTAHVIDVELNAQVAEFKEQLPPKEFGYFLVGLASEYNNALLAVDNSNIGWATLDAIIEREYSNLYYSPKTDKFNAQDYLKVYEGGSDVVPGFTMSMRSRPLIINKFREFVGDQSVTIKSKRLLEEMKVFIWKNGRPEAQSGYNDDLIMAFAIGMYLRDTSLQYRQLSIDRAKAALGGIQKTSHTPGVFTSQVQNPYMMDIKGRNEDFRWVL